MKALAWVITAAMALSMGACAASNEEVRGAKSTVYQGDGGQIFKAAEQAAGDKNYRIADADEGHLMYETVGRFYSPEGDLQSEGAGGYVRVDNRSVKVSFIVSVQQVANDQYVINVRPRTWQYMKGSPQMRELEPGDPYLPPWVLGRADHLQLAIYERAQGFATAGAAAPAPH